MAKSIKDLESGKTAPSKEEKDDKKKLSPEELKAQRVKNLKPKKKDPKKAAEDEQIKAHITKLLTESSKGLTAKEMRGHIFDTKDETQFPKEEKRIRFLAREMGCERVPIENSRQKLYKLPS